MGKKKPPALATHAERQAAKAPAETQTNQPDPPKEPTPVCLVENCGNEAKGRGLCGRCYSTAAGLVTKGKFTWEELVDMGLALPSRYYGAPNPFKVALVGAAQRKESTVDDSKAAVTDEELEAVASPVDSAQEIVPWKK